MKNIRYFLILIKGRKCFLKKIQNRQIYERLLKKAQLNDPFLYGHMTYKEYKELIKVVMPYTMANIMASRLTSNF